MKRRLLNGLTLLSLLLGLASAGLLARSYWVGDEVVHLRSDPPAGGAVRARILRWHSSRGSGEIWYAPYVWQSDPGDPYQGPSGVSEWSWQPAAAPAAGGRGLWRRLGFGFDRPPPVPAGVPRGAMVRFPLWLPPLLFSIPPAVRLCRRLWRRRSAPGFAVEPAQEGPAGG
jgi:hypothetical protein